jgi:hypothetical protein
LLLEIEVNMRYSPSTGTCYPEGIAYPNLPDDLVPISPEEEALRNSKPAGYSVSIVDGAPELSVLRGSRKTELKNFARSTRESGVFVDGLWFHTDPLSIETYNTMRGTNGDLPNTGPWKTMDGTLAQMTPARVKLILIACVALGTAIYNRKELLEAELLASNDPASVDITQGWPPRFEPAA